MTIQIESLWNIVTRRIRASGTIFGDRVKLVLRQSDLAHWAKLRLPYLLVVPMQTRPPTSLNIDFMSFVNPRAVTLVAQFDGEGSEAEYAAANAIELAEKQLIFILANWTPEPTGTFSAYRQTLYGGMRVQETREPHVKCHFYFTFQEEYVLIEISEIDDADLLGGLGRITVNVSDPCCVPYEEESSVSMPDICVTGGGCPQEPEPDPCAEPPCPPILDP